ncbi:NADPH2:quinone reductase [Sinosporangium album]|uniref:NADPH2:quinone reductase n=1 Tax=Sinosporangium album TaxID=504805 RepID=A0A1G7SJA4_9ACTN|nr:zinc-binding dehydrogenase [Sinosporangium album]SDG23125.1 NADPH2:quinone reductase [Sinosporangium album]
MRAIRLHTFGPAENLTYQEVPDPVPGQGAVRIRVEASGVHLLDTTLRKGFAAGPLPVSDLPMTPGREVAGTVDAVGSDVDSGWIGRRAVAHLGPASGGYAEQALAAATSLHEIPAHLDAAAAVAMIGTGRTAVAILDVTALTSQDTVLVTAAAGGLGNLFVQAAKAVGATVVGVAGGADKVERVQRLGADAAVDYLASDWPGKVTEALDGRGITVVMDGVGGALGRTAMEQLDVGGRLVLFGYSSGAITPFTSEDLAERGLSATWALRPRLMRRPGAMRDLETRALAKAAAGELTPLTTRFPLEKAAEAHRALEGRATAGKVVLMP